MITQAQKEKIQQAITHRNRHHSHNIGDVLYHYDEYMKDYRPGVVIHLIEHFGVMSYVMEVQTGPPINDVFLKMASEFQVKSAQEIGITVEEVDNDF